MACLRHICPWRKETSTRKPNDYCKVSSLNLPSSLRSAYSGYTCRKRYIQEIIWCVNFRSTWQAMTSFRSTQRHKETSSPLHTVYWEPGPSYLSTCFCEEVCVCLSVACIGILIHSQTRRTRNPWGTRNHADVSQIFDTRPIIPYVGVW